MKYSVIIPVYNVEKYLEKCMLSVLRQTYTDYEMIIVIDGATDGSEAVARRVSASYPDRNIRIIVQQNKGLGGARNTGMEYARGDYWLFLDSDDYLNEHALEILAEKTAEDAYDMIYFNTYVVNEKGEILTTLQVNAPEKKDTNLAESPELLQTYPAAWNKLYKKELFSDGIRYQEKKWFEDLDVALKFYLKSKRILFIEDTLYYYVQRKGSIMSDGNAARNMEMLDIFDSILTYYKKQGALEQYQKEIEYLAIWKIMIFVAGRISMADKKSPLLHKLSEYMQSNFPKYRENPYLGKMSEADRERFLLAADGKFDELYKKYTQKDKFKRLVKYMLPAWAAKLYYSGR